MKNTAGKILHNLQKMGAAFADIRIHLQDQAEHISTLCGVLDQYSYDEKKGYGIRVLAAGSWGFASGVETNDMQRVAELAYANACSAAKMQVRKVKLMANKPVQGVYHSPVEIDPFSVPLKEKVGRLLEEDGKLVDARISLWGASASFYKRRILYFDTDGAEIEKNLSECEGSLFCYADDSDGTRQRRSFSMYQDANGSVGWENFLNVDQFGQAERIKKELLMVIDAPQCKQETCDLILLPEMMALQTHETIGHALELDRILGYELSYAGGSHVDLPDFGHLVFGSDKLTARADGTIKNSPGSYGYDDDGVAAKNVVMIDKGLLVNAVTSRQMVVEANEKAGRTIFQSSGATNRAESFNRLPIERMNNINVDYGHDGTLETLIQGCENGLMVESPRSWSIGSNRENFHFASEIGWKIENGKVAHVVRNPTYRGNSLPFWRGLAKVGNQSTWQLQQVFNCGKGQPNQQMRLGHGVPICLFNRVEVGY